MASRVFSGAHTPAKPDAPKKPVVCLADAAFFGQRHRAATGRLAIQHAHLAHELVFVEAFAGIVRVAGADDAEAVGLKPSRASIVKPFNQASRT